MSQPTTETEAVAFGILNLVGTLPGRVGRLRAARIVGGFAVPDCGDDYSPFVGMGTWPLRELLELVDALISGGLIAQTMGARPTLVLTRAGHRSLESLEAINV